MKSSMSKSGFTLIELIIVIAIVGTLTTIFIPHYIELRGSAEDSARDGTAGSVVAGIAIFHAKQIASEQYPVWPSMLDNAPDGRCTPCSSNVPDAPLSDRRWSKSNYQYSYTASTGTTMTFNYDPATGKFMPTVSGN
jgi:prepilin-type N-terminal cleavage/methylation domain-containing protein